MRQGGVINIPGVCGDLVLPDQVEEWRKPGVFANRENAATIRNTDAFVRRGMGVGIVQKSGHDIADQVISVLISQIFCGSILLLPWTRMVPQAS